MRRTLALLCLFALAAPSAQAKPRHSRHRSHHAITKPTWLSGVQVTEYYAVPEAWFTGARVPAPGLAEAHRVDWLYSAFGVAVEGDGVDLAGRPVHVATVDGHGFVDAHGHRTSSAPAWLSGGYWLTSAHVLTFPLEVGGWSAGVGLRQHRPPARLTFAPGPSRALTPYRTLAVDPTLISLGSRVYIPAYVGVPGASGWFIAEDTGGAISGRHVDVYRPAPASRNGARMLTAQRILVEPPGTRAVPPAGPPRVAGGTPARAASLSCAATHLEAPCPRN
ncbi:MAG: 3D domain-containing protein [Solirubrobacteraceae bacterium]